MSQSIFYFQSLAVKRLYTQYIYDCISFLLPCNKSLQMKQLKTTPIYSFKLLRARGPLWYTWVLCLGYHETKAKVLALLGGCLLGLCRKSPLDYPAVGRIRGLLLLQDCSPCFLAHCQEAVTLRAFLSFHPPLRQ